MSRRRSSSRTESELRRGGRLRGFRGRPSAQRRLARTVVLGAVAVAAAIAWLASEFGMESRVLLDYATTSAMVVGALVVLGLAGAAVLRGLKRLFGRRR